MFKNFNNNSSRGFVAIIALLIMSSLVALAVYSISVSIQTKRQVSKNLLSSTQSYYLAESGMEDAVYRKIKGLNLPSGTLSLEDATIDQTLNTVGSVTTIDSVSNHLNNIRKLRTLLTITTTGVAFHYGVQVGEGGLTMGNGSIITGNLYSDGTVKGGTNDSKITGDVFVATGMSLDSDKGVWETQTTETIFGKTPTTDLGISYTPSISGKLSQVAFYVKRTSSIPGDPTIMIVTDNAGSPSTTLVEPTATATFTASKAGTAYGWAEFSFPNPPTLTAGTTYWIVIDANSSPTKYFYMGTGPGNVNSVSKYSSNQSAGGWTEDAGGDYNFKAWIGGQVTSLDSVIVGGSAHAHKITNTSATTRICGDAYYQEIDANSLSFLDNPTIAYCSDPLTPGTAHPGSPDPAVVALPLSSGNVTDWKNTAIGAGYLDPALCTSSASSITLNSGVLDCDFQPSSSSLVITLNGIVWVKGDIALPNNAIVQLSSGYASTSGIIIADAADPELKGKINTGNGTLICGSQGYDPGPPVTCNESNGSYIMLLSMYSGVDNAIEISNNASGAIYYAFAGKANVKNNASDVKEVTAYELNLENGASVTYESGLASAVFSTGPGGGWQLNNWNETE